MSEREVRAAVIRMATDAVFARLIRDDPAAAARAAGLTDDEVRDLRALRDGETGGAAPLDARLSKSGLGSAFHHDATSFVHNGLSDDGHHVLTNQPDGTAHLHTTLDGLHAVIALDHRGQVTHETLHGPHDDLTHIEHLPDGTAHRWGVLHVSVDGQHITRTVTHDGSVTIESTSDTGNHTVVTGDPDGHLATRTVFPWSIADLDASGAVLHTAFDTGGTMHTAYATWDSASGHHTYDYVHGQHTTTTADGTRIVTAYRIDHPSDALNAGTTRLHQTVIEPGGNRIDVHFDANGDAVSLVRQDATAHPGQMSPGAHSLLTPPSM